MVAEHAAHIVGIGFAVAVRRAIIEIGRAEPASAGGGITRGAARTGPRAAARARYRRSSARISPTAAPDEGALIGGHPLAFTPPAVMLQSSGLHGASLDLPGPATIPETVPAYLIRRGSSTGCGREAMSDRGNQTARRRGRLGWWLTREPRQVSLSLSRNFCASSWASRLVAKL